VNTSADTVSGRIENVVYRNESNDYTVLEIVTDKDELITAVGVIPMAFEGETVILGGSWSYHKEFGRQFCFTAYEKTLPNEVDGILQYLASGTVKGVGPVTARKIVERFGTDTFDVIENHPEWLSDISGITYKKAASISESFREQTGVRDIMMFCKDYFSSPEIARIYKKLGASSISTISENPYLLCESEYGISFEKVDKIAKSLNVSPESEVRILSAIRYVLSSYAVSLGHTCLPYNRLISDVGKLIEVADSVVEGVIRLFADTRLAIYETEYERYVMTQEVCESEKFITARLDEINKRCASFSISDTHGLIDRLETGIGIQYAKLQREAIYSALNNGVTIITGGPGTGKTTVVKALISIFGSMGLKTVLAAPTGRATKRMSEATSHEAKTIHRMLEMERNAEREVKFSRNRRNPIDESVVIIDEASMMDLALMDALLEAMKDGARLILIGDADQLPSVGAGNVFYDILSSGKYNTVFLTEIFRQAKESLIITNAHRINGGVSPMLNITNNDFFFVKCDERDIPRAVARLITERLPRTYGQSIREDIQVISPSKKGYGGIESLNSELQRQINPPSDEKKEKLSHGVIFREGDRVMQTVNNYDIEWQKGSLCGCGIFNGDIGVIESINHSKNEMKIRFDDKEVAYSFDLLEELELSYAITVHKSQGSEYPVVIIPMYSCAPMLMTRNLLYTAVTRARRMVILIGRADIPAKMVDNNSEIQRYTTLKYRISLD
jgi:exodeoxyribonuclease V alpha subunit